MTLAAAALSVRPLTAAPLAARLRMMRLLARGVVATRRTGVVVDRDRVYADDQEEDTCRHFCSHFELLGAVRFYAVGKISRYLEARVVPPAGGGMMAAGGGMMA